MTVEELRNALDALITSVSTLVTAAIGWVGDFITEITAQPLLLLFVVAVPLVGLGVGIINRLIRV